MWFGLFGRALYIILNETGVIDGPPLEKRPDEK